MASKGPFEGLDVTADEVQRIGKALKNEEFRKLFVDYANELADPENKKKYEEELAELERSRGMDVKFLHPKPGYVLKTSVDGEKKAFINICMNEHIGKPQAGKSKHKNGKVGVEWSLPYSLAPGRDDLDHAGKKCVVYDCLFHPECFELTNKEGRFQTLMEGTALDGIEREFQVKLDRHNVKRPKMKFKGRPQATVLRTPNKQGATGENSLDALNLKYPYEKPESNGISNAKAKSATKIVGNRNEKNTPVTDARSLETNNGFTKPKFSIVHRGHFDMQQFTFARDSMPSTRPQELIVKVELPLLKSAATVQLDVFEKRLQLECQKPVSYRLDLPLPYPVDKEKGSARFDKSKACLIITLAVLPPEIPKILSMVPEASESKPLIQEISPSPIDPSKVEEPESIAPTDNDAATEEKLVSVNESGDNLQCEGMESGPNNTEKWEALDPEPSSKPISNEMNILTTESSVVQNGVAPPADVQESQADVQSDQMSTTPFEYEFHQSDDTVTFIFHSADIDPETLTAVIQDEGKIFKVSAKRKTSGARGSPSTCVQNLVVKCSPGHSFDEDVKTSVSDSNVVVTLKKPAACRESWSAFSAGISMETLQEQKFLTVESLEEVLEDAGLEQRTKAGRVPCTVTGLSTESLKAEFQIQKPSPDGQHTVKVDSGADSGQPSKPAESIVPALDLSRQAEVAKHDSDSDPQSSPSTSSPSTASLPSSLKSALRSPRRHASKSVSFSEDVLVELFLEGPNRAQKKGNKRKGGRRGPFFGPKRLIEKLKDNSWQSYSDSELLHRHANGEDDEQEDHDGPEWELQPNTNLMRQSSSESESGLEIPSSPRSKGKKSKGSRRRRKEKARREASLASESNGDGAHSDDVNGGKDLPPCQEQTKTDPEGGSNADDNEAAPLPESHNDSDSKNNNEIIPPNDNDELPLEMQDHKTKCAFEFSNQLIYELDE